MKNIIVILICMLLSAWAISTFFDAPEETQIAQRLEQTNKGHSAPAAKMQSTGQVTAPVAANKSLPGKAVRLELPGAQEKNTRFVNSVSQKTKQASKEAARAVRVVPRQTQSARDNGPIPEPDMPVTAEFVVQEGHAGDIEGLVFGPNGKYLATSEYNKRVKLWDIKTGQLIRTFHHKLAYEHGPVVEFSANGRLLYTGGGMPFTIKAWDLAADKLVREATPGSVADFQRGPHGKLLAGYGWGNLTIMDAEQLGTRRVLKSKEQWGSFSSLVIDIDPRYCFSGHSNGTIAHWDIQSGSQLQEFSGHEGSIQKLFISRSGEFLISVGWEDGKVKVWDRKTFKLIRTIQAHAPDHPRRRSHLHGAALDSTHQYLLTGGSDGYVKLWSLRDGHQLRTFQKAGLSRYEEIRVLGIDPTGTYVAAGGREGRVWVWDFDSGQIIRKISGRLPQVSHRDEVAFKSEKTRTLNDTPLADVPLIVDVNPGLDHLAVRNDREEYAIWDLQGVRLLKHFSAEEKVTFCKLGPLGKRAYTGHKDQRLVVWDLGAGTRLQELSPPKADMQVSWIKASPDAKTLVSQHQSTQKFMHNLKMFSISGTCPPAVR